MPQPARSQTSATRTLRALRKQIGQNIHAARTARKMRLEKLARRCGLSPALIDGLELGKGEIRLEHIVRLAAAMNVNIASLLNAQ